VNPLNIVGDASKGRPLPLSEGASARESIREALLHAEERELLRGTAAASPRRAQTYTRSGSEQSKWSS
jgi:hypothetical protein